MGKTLTAFMRDVFLAFSVFCGPSLWIVGFLSASTAWQPGTEAATMLHLLVTSFVLMCCALWGIVSGPSHLPHWCFGLPSVLNLVTGFAIVVSGHEHSVPIGTLFLGYSLWQFVVFRRPRVHIVS